MPNTCGIYVTSEVIKIHAGYMRDTFGIHLGYMRDTYLGGLWECIDAMYRQLPWRKAKLQGRAVRVEARGQGWKAQHWLLLPGGLPAIRTAEGDEVEQGKEDEQEDDVVGDDNQEAQQPPAKKQKGGKGAAQAPVPAVAPAKAPKARGKAKESPQRSSKRGRK
jgi:hypothetical protein